MRNSSESEVTLVTLEHAECQKVLKVQKLKTTFQKSWESKRSLINFDKFPTCDLPSSLMQKRVSVGGDGAIRIASGLQNPKYFEKTYPRYFQHIILKMYPRYILKSSKRLSTYRMFFDWFLKVVSACWGWKNWSPNSWFLNKQYQFTEKEVFQIRTQILLSAFSNANSFQIRIVSCMSLLWKRELRLKDFGPSVLTN